MRKFILVLAGFLYLIHGVSASYITISVGMMSGNFINQSSGLVNVTVSNLGDEPAYDVYLNLASSGGFSSGSLFAGVLNPNQTILVSFPVNASDAMIPGDYYSNLVVRYSDGNGYPFSMVNPVRLIYKNFAKSAINGSMEKLEIAGSQQGKLRVTLLNTDSVPHEVALSLKAPSEIKTDFSARKISVPANGRALVEYNVSSFGALPGSRYLVFAVAEYDDVVHRSVALRNVIEIKSEGRLFGSLAMWVVITAVAILVIALAYMQIASSKSFAKHSSKKSVNNKKSV